MRVCLLIILGVAALFTSSCAGPKIKLFVDASDPLQEFVLEGTQKGKVLVISIKGVISDESKKGVFRERPSVVQETVSQLLLAESDKEVRAVVIKMDSPGGPTTASDLLYHEIMAFKKRTGVKVVVAMMDVAASGGYYVSLAADFILAHPTTVTGSIGVIFIRPMVTGLMEKIGLDVKVTKSGRNKDMGSPFRQTTEEEQKIFNSLVDKLAERFINLVHKQRKLDKKAIADISTGRVYLAKEALQLGLVDEIGYLNDALLHAKKLAGLPQDSKVIVYRRTEYPDDNLYNTAAYGFGGSGLTVIDLGLPECMSSLHTGFYYLWLPSLGRD